MDRRKVIKYAAGGSAALAGLGVAGYYVMERIFNPKTAMNYVFPPVLAAGDSLPLTPACEGHSTATPIQTEGPFYTPDTPLRQNLRAPDITGFPLLVEGYVLDKQCRPIAGAVLDFWSCDGDGVYDNDGYTLRGHQFTDEKGYYRLATIRPGSYTAGPFVRTAHIHVKCQSRDSSMLTTQLYFPGEADNQRDDIFDPALLLVMHTQPGNEQRASFNFVLDRVPPP